MGHDSAAYANQLNDLHRVMRNALEMPTSRLDQAINLLADIRDTLKEIKEQTNAQQQ